MFLNNKIIIGKNDCEEFGILLDKANRHGLITGASGSGKTVTLKVLAESFSDANVPVFFSDVKGDLSGCAAKGEATENIVNRLKKINVDNFDFKSYPTRFWDVYGEYGHPIRVKISSVGPQILSIMLGLSEAQEGVLDIVFKIARDENLSLIDLKDLRSVLQYIGDNRKDYITKYGNITTQSVGVIQRSLITLENQGAENFFGEPELDIKDFISFDDDGRGFINILHAVELFKNPDLYASFLLWLLTELFNKLPEVGDLDKPKIIFFFDEAHLLFNGMPQYRLKQITQIVKLIRSRGIGLYFVSQSPIDIPNEIISQLGNRIQHTLRAYTPSEQKIVKAAADSFRTNPKFNTIDAILSLGTGEALISCQNENGEPNIVEKITVLPPQSMLGPINDMTRNKIINNSSLIGKYDEAVNNHSAEEVISEKYEEIRKEKEEEEKRRKEEKEEIERRKEEERIKKEEEKQLKEEERKQKESQKLEEKKKKEEEKAKKNSIGYKLGKKVTNKAVDKVINKGLNSIFKNLFK